MIQVKDLAKYFSGHRALGPVSFDISDGECVGFLGLNGAGKTTALRILACDLRPSSGSVRIGDVDALKDPHEVRKQVGFLPETPPLYADMDVGEFLVFAGKLRGMSTKDVKRRLPEVLAVTHLEDVAGQQIRSLSHGYKQRVGVAQAIVHQPKLLILDEPTRGLDPVQIVEMRAMIRDLKKSHTVLISSHILPEISETCDRLLVLGKGTIVGSGTEEELSHNLSASRRIVVAARGDKAELVELVRGLPGVVSVTPTGEVDGAVELDVATSSDVRGAVCRALVEKGHDVIKLDRAQHQLESIFLELVTPAVALPKKEAQVASN